jgi:hypothetical protein
MHASRSNTFARVALLATALTPLCFDGARAAAPETGPRYSAEVVQLLQMISGNYDVGVKQVVSTRDTEVLGKLARADDRLVRDIAQMALRQGELQVILADRQRITSEEFNKQIKNWPTQFSGMVLQSMNREAGNSGSSDMHDAAKLLEEMVGEKLIPQTNAGLAFSYLGLSLNIALTEKLRELANRSAVTETGLKFPVKVRMETGPKLGAVAITNQSGKNLHSCLILTHFVSDKEIVRAGHQQQELAGALLPIFGFSPETTQGSVLTGRLRTLISVIDRDAMIYVPEIASGATVRTFLCPTSYVAIAKSAEISVWSDELTALGQEAKNVEEAKAASRATKPGTGFVRPGTKSKPSAKPGSAKPRR